MKTESTAPTTAEYRYIALGIFTLTYTLNFVDRQILSILQEPIKSDLGLSDTQLGLLTGFAFALFYVSLGFPIARLADRSNRKRIVVWCLSLWGTMTMLCGLTVNYWQLLMARIGVGVGEAGCTPPLHSMISDIFPKRERGTALGIYNSGVNIGVLVGFLLGGWITQFFDWRIALLLVGVPGLVLALIFQKVVKEPPRLNEHGGSAESQAAPMPYKEILGLFLSVPTLRWLVVAAMACGISGYGLLNWTPSFLLRNFDIQPGMVGTYLALIVGIGGGLMTFLVGYLGDKFSSRGMHWYLWVTSVFFTISLPALYIMLTAQSAVTAILGFVIPGLIIQCYLAPMVAVTHSIVPANARAFSSAFLLFAVNIIGLGAGPVLVGFISDTLAPDLGEGDGLRYAMIAVVGASSLLAAISLAIGGISHRRMQHRTPVMNRQKGAVQ